MDEPQSHRCRIIGLGSGARAAYVIRNVRPGDPIDLRLRVDDPYDPFTVAAYHDGHFVGYVASDERWVAHSLKQGDRHTAVVSTFETDAYENLTALVIELAILKDDVEIAGRATTPAPGTAPWAPRIVRAPPARWPVVIPLSLLAGIAFGAWLLMERGLLPSLARFAGAP